MLTEQELQRRLNYVNASEVAAVLGVSPWETPRDLAIRKRDAIHTPANYAMAAGNALEPLVLEMASETLGPLQARGEWRVHSNGVNAATLDAMTADGEIVEAKTVGILRPAKLDEWGDPDTDEVPLHYLVQVQAQMLVTGAQVGWVAALLGGVGFRLYRVERCPLLTQIVEERSVEFMARLQAGELPEGTASLETLAMRTRVPRKEVDLDAKLVTDYLLSTEIVKAAKANQRDCQSRLIDALGDAEIGRSDGGTVTYTETKRGAYSVEATTYRRFAVRKKGTQ